MGNRVTIVALIFALAQTEVSCNTTGSPGPGAGTATPGTATTSCPIPAPYKVQVSGEVSSVTVQPGGAAQDERASNAPWCNTTEVSLTKLSVSNAVSANGCPASRSDTTPPCSTEGMLAAVELKPTPIKFPTSASQPELVYDLNVNKPQEGCVGCQLEVFQLFEPRPASGSNWRWVAYAYRSTFGSTPIATARVNHFSVFALVELPAPEVIVPGAAAATFIVGSDFIAEREGTTISVQLAFVEGSIDTSRKLDKETSRVFRFEQFAPVSGLDDPSCTGEPADAMTCLFPLGTEVRFEYAGDGTVSIGRVVDAYRVDFTATVAIL